MDDITSHVKAITDSLSQFLSGVSSTGGKSGGFVDVQVNNPLPGQLSNIRARCATDCPPGAIQLIKTSDNEWFAVSSLSTPTTPPQSKVDFSHKKPPPLSQKPGGLILCTSYTWSWLSNYEPDTMNWQFENLPKDALISTSSAVSFASWISQLLGVISSPQDPPVSIPSAYLSDTFNSFWDYKPSILR